MAPRRLRIDGSRIMSPQGEPLRLRGFNVMYMLDSEFKLPRDDMDGEIRRRLPGTNVLRLVILHWDDKPTTNNGKDSSNDCAQTTDGQPISQRCLRQIDAVLQWAAGQGLWTILTARASLAAGEAVNGRVGPTLFDDAELRARFLSMWSVVAERYKNYDMIAGYEPLSEPRVTTNRDRVRSFYAEACRTVWAHDGAAPCFVGPAPFYDRANIEESLLAGTANRVVYNFNFFAPLGFVAGESYEYENRKWRVIEYPGPMPCCHVHDKSHAKCCHGQCCDANIHTDRSTLDGEMQVPLAFSKKHAVPVMMDQWGVMRDHPRAASQAKYLLDMMVLLEKYQLHWTYWQWRHRADRQYAIMTLRDGKPELAERVVDRLRLALGPPGVLDGPRCYAERYPDLVKGYCGGEMQHCNWPDLLSHWEEHGKTEGRVYDCGGRQQVAVAHSPPPPPPPVQAVPVRVISPPPFIAQSLPTQVTTLQQSSPPPPPPAKALLVTFLAASPPPPSPSPLRVQQSQPQPQPHEQPEAQPSLSTTRQPPVSMAKSPPMPANGAVDALVGHPDTPAAGPGAATGSTTSGLQGDGERLIALAALVGLPLLLVCGLMLWCICCCCASRRGSRAGSVSKQQRGASRPARASTSPAERRLPRPAPGSCPAASRGVPEGRGVRRPQPKPATIRSIVAKTARQATRGRRRDGVQYSRVGPQSECDDEDDEDWAD